MKRIKDKKSHDHSIATERALRKFNIFTINTLFKPRIEGWKDSPVSKTHATHHKDPHLDPQH